MAARQPGYKFLAAQMVEATQAVAKFSNLDTKCKSNNVEDADNLTRCRLNLKTIMDNNRSVMRTLQAKVLRAEGCFDEEERNQSFPEERRGE